MKFIVTTGEEMREQLRNFPWANVFLPSKMLVVGVEDDVIAAVLGVRSVLNIMTEYVSEEFRGRGLGREIFERTVDAARERGFHFLTCSVFTWHKVSLNLPLRSRSPFKMVRLLKKLQLILFMLPLTAVGYVFYFFFQAACCLVPNDFLSYVTERVFRKTVVGEEGYLWPEDAGVYHFKSGLGGDAVNLKNHFFFRKNVEVPDPLQMKYVLLARLWSKLPKSLASKVGPSMVSRIGL